MTGPTKSFIALAVITLVFSGFTLIVSEGGISKPRPTQSGASGLPANHSQVEDRSIRLFDQSEYGIRFEYPESWAVETTTENGFDTINLFPPNATTPVSIHIGSTYYGLGSLQTTKTTVHGYEGVSAGAGLVGIANKDKRYTFDLGTHEAQQREFQAMLDSLSLY